MTQLRESAGVVNEEVCGVYEKKESKHVKDIKPALKPQPEEHVGLTPAPVNTANKTSSEIQIKPVSDNDLQAENKNLERDPKYDLGSGFRFDCSPVKTRTVYCAYAAQCDLIKAMFKEHNPPTRNVPVITIDAALGTRQTYIGHIAFSKGGEVGRPSGSSGFLGFNNRILFALTRCMFDRNVYVDSYFWRGRSHHGVDSSLGGFCWGMEAMCLAHEVKVPNAPERPPRFA
ncbi:hypothetical protein IFR05_005549 [Cadophora sp. M221]|nr:hypothetical protein IFR05_005549 [Cadophora sp. M221]